MKKSILSVVCLASVMALSLSACNDDDDNTMPSVTTAGSTSGTTAGTTSGTTAGTTSGTTSGSTSGTTSGPGNSSFTIGASSYTNAIVQCGSQQNMFGLVGATSTGSGLIVYLGGGMPAASATYPIAATGVPGMGQASIIASADQSGTNSYLAISGQVQVLVTAGRITATFTNVPAMNPLAGS